MAAGDTMLVLPIHGRGILQHSNTISNLRGCIRRMLAAGVHMELGKDPLFSLSPYCSYLDRVPYDFSTVTENQESEYKTYLITFHPIYNSYSLYVLNETMDFIVKKFLEKKSIKLSSLKKIFLHQYKKFGSNEAISVFNNGIMLLNEIESLSAKNQKVEKMPNS